MSAITTPANNIGTASSDVAPITKLPKAKRIKHELKINPSFLNSIEYIKEHYHFTTTSSVIENVFDKKSFSTNKAQKSIDRIRSTIKGFCSQSFTLLEYCINKSEKSIQQKTANEKCFQYMAEKSKATPNEVFYATLKNLNNDLDKALTKYTSIKVDNSEEIQNIQAVFKTDIDDDLPKRRNLSFRLNEDVDGKYFPSNKPTIGDSEFRRVLHQALMKNTNFLVCNTSKELLEHINKATNEFNDSLEGFNTLKKQGKPVDLLELFKCILKLRVRINKYEEQSV